MPLNHFVTLGRSGLRVSPLCLGTMTFGQDWVGARLLKTPREFWIDAATCEGPSISDSILLHSQTSKHSTWVCRCTAEPAPELCQKNRPLRKKTALNPALEGALHASHACKRQDLLHRDACNRYCVLGRALQTCLRLDNPETRQEVHSLCRY